MSIILYFFFWTPLTLIAYSYIGYPIILAIVVLVQNMIQGNDEGAGQESESEVVQFEPGKLPTVGVVISAYNEETTIEDRIKNLMSLDYPLEKIKFYIGSDGSTDNTNNIVESWKCSNLVFVPFDVNRGKASVLNDLVNISSEEILVFSDANTKFSQDAIKNLVRHFSNEAVYAVCGELNLVANDQSNSQDGVYWKLEKYLKERESQLNSLLGANGAIYAIKRESFKALPADTITDDFTIVLNISLKGNKVLYDPEAKAVEKVAPSVGDEYKRRVRIGSGNYQAFLRHLRLLNPKYGWLWFSYISHKVIRWFTPHFLMFALFVNCFLIIFNGWYLLPLIAQLLVYGISYRLRDSEKVGNKIIDLAVYWVNMNIALGHGFIRYCSKQTSGTWERTNR